MIWSWLTGNMKFLVDKLLEKKNGIQFDQKTYM